MPDADLILYNAKVYTLNRKKPEAQAIGVKGNKIVKVGSNVEVLKLKTFKTNAIDLKGKTVLPGFVDCHIHMRSYAKTLEQIELRDVVSIKQLQRRLRKVATARPSSTWITARGFDEEKFKEKRLPTRFDLDKAVLNNPVLLTRVCGHLSVANSKALELADITKDTALAEGGIIQKNPKTGDPTGILLENAQNLVAEVIPKPDKKELLRIYEKACQKAAEKGLTSAHCIIYDPKDVSVVRELRRQNKLKLRIHLIIPVEYLDELDELASMENRKTRMGSIKVYADGSLGAHTAALHKPYADDKTTKGIHIYPQKKLEKLLLKVHENGFQLAIHAIGDEAVESVLDALEKALRQKPKEDHRHRIEHASVLSKRLIRRMKKLGVIASVQPHFVASDFWTAKRLGKRRARWTYSFKSLIKSGIVTCGGSDCPIEPIDPLLGIWAAVARKIFPQERLTVDEAIRLYTINAAFVSREENVKGSIERGKFADLTVLSQDPYKIEADNIRSIRVDMTIVDGEIVYVRTT
jgi:hypothetical protein